MTLNASARQTEMAAPSQATLAPMARAPRLLWTCVALAGTFAGGLGGLAGWLGGVRRSRAPASGAAVTHLVFVEPPWT